MLLFRWRDQTSHARERPELPEDVRIKIPLLQIDAARTKNTLEAPALRIDINLRLTPESLSGSAAPTKGLPPSEEMEHVARMSGIVAQRVWNDLILETYETAAQTIAEAILRVVQTRDESFLTSGVWVHLQVPSRESTYGGCSGEARLVDKEHDTKAKMAQDLVTPSQQEIRCARSNADDGRRANLHIPQGSDVKRHSREYNLRNSSSRVCASSLLETSIHGSLC